MLKAVNVYLQFVLLKLDLSLNGLDEMLVGNTAEKVLDKLDCDVLLLSASKSEA